jgi:Arc/MetJ-type ribon-helix-helix transcriptional regulator
MSHDLSHDSEAFIADAIARGAYRDRADVIDAGLAMLRRHESLLAWIDEGRRQLDEGEYVELDDEGLKELSERLKERARMASRGG